MTISEAAEQYDLTPDTLRYYERLGLIPPVPRSAGGIRQYTEADCDWISFIKCMRSAGVSVDTLVEYVRLYRQGDATADRRRQLLLDEHARIARQIGEMQDVLARLERKIAGLGRCEQQLQITP